MNTEKGFFEKLLRDREKFYDDIFSKNSEKFLGGTILKLLAVSIIFFGIYGIVMGLYNSPIQSLSSAVKVPVLFLLSLLICYPAMFVFNILLGSKLNFKQSLAMILSAYALTSCVLVSFAPIVLFFMLIGSSYAFLRLLNVAIFAVSGLSGMAALNSGLKYACEKHSIYPRQGVQVFKVWVIIFAFVGTQLAWNMRPFIGNRNEPFQL
ncbi:actin-binding WH2 domain-containing protein, partial [bacterium]